MVRGVHYVSFNNVSGYGTAAVRAIGGLLDAGVAVRWTPLRWEVGGGVVDLDVTAAPERLRALVSTEVDCDVAVIHTPPGSWARLRPEVGDLPTVGATVWETTRTPDTWPAWCDAVDHVVVPCEWNVDVLRSSGIRAPLSVVPHCPPAALPDDRVVGDDAPFTFTTIGEWTARKAIGDTLEAYLRAFDADDPVRLVVKTSPADMSGELDWGGGSLAGTTMWSVAQALRRHNRPAEVTLVTATLDETGIADLHRRTDCFVSLAHSEGFGLGAFEAAAHGRPVVATGWGGWLDYLDPADAHLVDHTLVAVDDPIRRESTAGQQWAQADVDHAAALLRRVVADVEDSRARGVRLRDRIAREMSSAASTARLLDVLEEVAAG